MNSRNMLRFGLGAASLLSSTFSFFSPSAAEKYPPRLTNLVDPSGVYYGIEQYQDSYGYANDWYITKAIAAMRSEYNMSDPYFIPAGYDTFIKSWKADGLFDDLVSLFRNGAMSNKELEDGLISLLDNAEAALVKDRQNAGIYTGITMAILLGMVGIGFGIACLVSCVKDKKQISSTPDNNAAITKNRSEDVENANSSTDKSRDATAAENIDSETKNSANVVDEDKPSNIPTY